MDSEHHITSNVIISNSHSPEAAEGTGARMLNKTLSYSFSSCSSSPDSPLDDPFGDQHDELEKLSTSSSIPLPKQDAHPGPKSTQKESDHEGRSSTSSEESVGTHDNHDLRPPGDLLSAEPPSPQSMDRSPDLSSNYRIPSSVFTRTKSTAPMEWSAASNESLFSIHMGNMSFTKDQFLYKSGELVPPYESSVPSHEMFNIPPPSPLPSPSPLPPPSPSPAAANAPRDDKDRELEAANAVEAMKEVARETEDRSSKKALVEDRLSFYSEASSNSTKSFAFPILTGDDKGSSVKFMSSAKIISEQQQQQHHSQLQQRSHSPSMQKNQPESPVAVEKAPQPSNRWFSCFSCCSFCW